MQAGQTACACPDCGVVCHGLFEGCPDVWERGLRPVMVIAKPDESGNGIVPAQLEPVGFVNGRSSVLTAAEIEGGRSVTAGADEDLIGVEAATRAAARFQTARAAAVEEARRAAGQAEGAGPATAQDEGDPTDQAEDARRSAEERAAQAEDARRAAAQAEADRAAADDDAAARRAADHEGARRAAASGQRTNGNPAALGAGPSTGAPRGDARSDVLRWFEEAFEGLRTDLRELVTGMTQQQAMIAELLDTRQADLRLVVVAEGLPDVVQDAVEAAVADHTGEVEESIDSALGELRQSIKKTESASVAAVGKLRRTLEAAEATAAGSLEEVHRRQEEAEARAEARARALKASLTKQLKPMAEALGQALERSDQRMDEINRRLDNLAKPAAAPPTKRAAPAKSAAPARKAAATKRTAPVRKAAPAKATAPVTRRQPLRGLRTLEER